MPEPEDAPDQPEPTELYEPGSGPMPSFNAGALFAQGMGAGPLPRVTGRWQPPSVEELRAELAQFEIIELIGRGGMGAVYQGRHRRLDRRVAIKILPSEMAGEPEYAARFLREARAMAQLTHPGIVAVHDAGETPDGLLYFVMDFVEGTDVQKLVAERGRLPIDEALSITAAVCDALAYAHSQGIIHRDIKPSNVMVDVHGQVKVADFGLAKIAQADASLLTASDARMGTTDFMAPESVQGTAQVDHRADLFAIGVMLYQMLTGKVPRGRFEPPSRLVPGLDRRLDPIIDRALQSEREARFASAIQLRGALAPVLARHTVGQEASAVRSPVVLWLGAVMMLAAVGGAGWFWGKWHAHRATAPASLSSAAAPALPAPGSLQWERFEFAKMPPLEATQHRKNVEMQGEFLHARKNDGWSYLRDGKKFSLRNAAVRVVIDWWAFSDFPKIIFREGTGVSSHCFVRLGSDGIEFGIHSSGDRTLQKFAHQLKPPRTVTLQAALIGSRMTVWLDGVRLGEVDGFPADEPGVAGVQASDSYFRSIEVVNLDGRSDAEALEAGELFAGLDGSKGMAFSVLGSGFLVHGWFWLGGCPERRTKNTEPRTMP